MDLRPRNKLFALYQGTTSVVPRAAKMVRAKESACELAGPISVPTTNQRVPHISLVFREMWETTDLDWQSLESRRM